MITASASCQTGRMAETNPGGVMISRKGKRMKTRFVTLLLLAGGMALATNQLHAQNLVQNGSFERNNSEAGWSLSGGLFDLGGAGAGVQCADGYNAVGPSSRSTLYQ